jgi:putative SOS response-associated peptidase YedK
MCGRSSLHDAPVSILERFQLPPVVPGFKPRYNIAPTQEQLTILCDGDGQPVLKPLRWGLVPSWSSDRSNGGRMINARSDTLATKTSWESLLRKRRCLVLADGYYEWAGTGKARTPMFFHLSGHRPFAMAGVWDVWNREGDPLETCAIITTSANTLAARYHHRMPVVLSPEESEEWLDESTRGRRAVELMAPYKPDDLECYEVSRYVNSPANDSPDCIAPVT